MFLLWFVCPCFASCASRALRLVLALRFALVLRLALALRLATRRWFVRRRCWRLLEWFVTVFRGSGRCLVHLTVPSPCHSSHVSSSPLFSFICSCCFVAAPWLFHVAHSVVTEAWLLFYLPIKLLNATFAEHVALVPVFPVCDCKRVGNTPSVSTSAIITFGRTRLEFHDGGAT